MTKQPIKLATALAGLAMIGLLALPTPSLASTKGKRNTTYLLGAASAWELLHHKTTNGLILGAGTAYAYSRYNKSRKNDRNHRTYRRVTRTRVYRHRRY